MKKEKEKGNVIKNMDITIKTKNVLTALGIFTIEDLHLSYILGTLPSIGTIVKYYPFSNVTLEYTEKINQEVRSILLEYCSIPIDQLHHVGH